MSRDMDLLEPDFRHTCDLLLARLAKRNHNLKPFYTRRDVHAQSRLWRQSRTTVEINEAVSSLKRESAPYLADVLVSVGPQYGRWATNALPGQSWHQWDEALDCYVVGPKGRAMWSRNNAGYRHYAEEAVELGLNAGFFWEYQDAVHVQKRSSTVRNAYTWNEIDLNMEKKYAD